MRNHAFTQGRALYDALGAEKVYEVTPFASGHNMGSCRMSERPEDGVCNKWGQTHEIQNLFISDGSQFSTSAAPNPTLHDRRARDPPGGLHRRPDGETRHP